MLLNLLEDDCQIKLPLNDFLEINHLAPQKTNGGWTTDRIFN